MVTNPEKCSSPYRACLSFTCLISRFKTYSSRRLKDIKFHETVFCQTEFRLGDFPITRNSLNKKKNENKNNVKFHPVFHSPLIL